MELTHGHGDHPDHHDEAHHHVTSPAVYLKTFGLLLVFMALTIVVSKWNLGAMNNVIAMAIAITKATLVVLFFMQVKYGTRLTWLWASLGFIWLLLIFLIVSDYWTREWLPLHGWQQVHGPHK